VSEALRVVDAGRSVRLTDEQWDENKRKSNLQATHDHRASTYGSRFWSCYQERTARLHPGDAKERAQVAADIIKEAESRRGPAKQEGIRLFREQVKKDLTSRQARTVRKNSR
jgi:hypothetical protein